LTLSIGKPLGFFLVVEKEAHPFRD
jgi:hypothetical protein